MFKSGIDFSIYFERDPPNAILLNMKIVYAELSTIEEEAIAPRRGSLSNAPYRDMNSPTKFIVKGVPALARHSMKNSIEKRGII